MRYQRRVERMRRMRTPGIILGGLLGLCVLSWALVYALGGRPSISSPPPPSAQGTADAPSQQLFGGQTATAPISQPSIVPAAAIAGAMQVQGVSPENASVYPQFYYNADGVIGAKVYTDANLAHEVMLGENNWLLLINGDQVALLENMQSGIVKVRILTNQSNGQLADGGVNPDVIGKEVYLEGWVITGKVPAK